MLKRKIKQKISPSCFADIMYGIKTFEVCKNDNNAKVGDTLVLREWTGGEYTGREIEGRITYMLQDTKELGLKPGYCVMAIDNVKVFE